MRRLLTGLALVLALCAPVGAGDGRTYLDLSVDPVGAVVDASKAKAAGWTPGTLAVDSYVTVEFQRRDGTRYYETGWLEAGTDYYAIVGQDKVVVLSACSNLAWIWWP